MMLRRRHYRAAEAAAEAEAPAGLDLPLDQHDAKTLKAECERLGLAKSGNKAALVKRIGEAYAAAIVADEESTEDGDDGENPPADAPEDDDEDDDEESDEESDEDTPEDPAA